VRLNPFFAMSEFDHMAEFWWARAYELVSDSNQEQSFRANANADENICVGKTRRAAFGGSSFVRIVLHEFAYGPTPSQATNEIISRLIRSPVASSVSNHPSKID